MIYNDDCNKWDGEGWYWFDEMGDWRGRYATYEEALFDCDWYYAHH